MQIQNLPWPDFSVALPLTPGWSRTFPLKRHASGLPVKTCLLTLSTLAFHSIWLWCQCFLVICYLAMVFNAFCTEASKATLITLIEPLVATLFAIFLIGEVFKPVGWVGMTLVCLCLLIQSIKFPFALNAAMFFLQRRNVLKPRVAYNEKSEYLSKYSINFDPMF